MSIVRKCARLACVISLLLLASCNEHASDVSREPTTAYQFESPQFSPLGDSEVAYGELNASVYKMERPANWNGNLVVYLPGSQRFTQILRVDAPRFRESLLDAGYAWASMSYDTGEPISAREAELAATLVPEFERRLGTPSSVLAVADSAGGDGALVAMEDHEDVFDGAVVACGVAGVLASYDTRADFITAAGYAIGLGQAEWDTRFSPDFVFDLSFAVSATPETYERFLAAWIQVTGGSRPMAVEGFEVRNDLWALAKNDVGEGLAQNADRRYEMEPSSGIDEKEFNQRAIRIERDARWSSLNPGDPTGDIQRPVVFLHTSGDAIVPLGELQLNAGRIQTSDRANLARVRIFPRANHCDFTSDEYLDAISALSDWTQDGAEPPADRYGPISSVTGAR